MARTLFQEAKDEWDDFVKKYPAYEPPNSEEEDKQKVINAIQNAYNEATPEQIQQLLRFEQQLD